MEVKLISGKDPLPVYFDLIFRKRRLIQYFFHQADIIKKRAAKPPASDFIIYHPLPHIKRILLILRRPKGIKDSAPDHSEALTDST